MSLISSRSFLRNKDETFTLMSLSLPTSLRKMLSFSVSYCSEKHWHAADALRMSWPSLTQDSIPSSPCRVSSVLILVLSLPPKES